MKKTARLFLLPSFNISVNLWWLPVLITPPLIFTYFKLREREEEDNGYDEKTIQSVPLLKIETSKIMMEKIASIDSITFFQGKAPVEDIKMRLKLILKANPWLAGHLVKRSNSIHLEFSRNGENNDKKLDEIFKELPVGLVDISSDYTKMVNSLQQPILLVPYGKTCLKNKSALLKVSIIPLKNTKNKNKFAIVVSLSHVIADGHTYYMILKMLSNKSHIISLNPKRHVNDDELKRKLIGYEEDLFPMSLKVILCIIWKSISRPKILSKLYHINKSIISQIKLKQDEVPFISTNDIITSYFFSQIKPRVGMMAINWRNRAQGVENNDAGNYESLILLNGQTRTNEKADYANPSLIRKSVTPNNNGVYQRAQHLNAESESDSSYKLSKLPSFMELLKGELAIISNWSNFGFDEIKLLNCEQKYHIPLLRPTLFQLCVIFTPKPNELAALVFSDNFQHQESPFLPVGNRWLTQMFK